MEDNQPNTDNDTEPISTFAPANNSHAAPPPADGLAIGDSASTGPALQEQANPATSKVHVGIIKDIPPSESPAFNPNNPPVANPANTFLTGSQLQLKEPPLPKGVYGIIVIGVAGFIASFFDTSQNNLVYTIDLLLVLVLTIGLFFRIDLARKILFYLSVLTVIASVVAIIGFIGLQNRVNQAKQKSDAAIARLEGQPLTSTQRQQLDAAKLQLDSLQKQFGRSKPFVFAKYMITIVAYSVVAIYLTRPKVKEVFKDWKS